MTEASDQVAGLSARYAALRQAAGSKGADRGGVLEAAFTELEEAIDLLRGAESAPRDGREPGTPAETAERGDLSHGTTLPPERLLAGTLAVSRTTVIGAFDLVNVMTQGGPLDASNVFVFNIYRTAFTYFQMGYASAMAYILFLIVLVFTMIQWWLQKRWVHY